MSRVSRRIGNERLGAGQQLKLLMNGKPRAKSITPNKANALTYEQATSSPRGRVVHCKRAAYDVYIGRPSRWGNPFPICYQTDRAKVIADYERWLNGEIEAPRGQKPPSREEIRSHLAGKVLGCWCAPLACHGDVLARIANAL